MRLLLPKKSQDLQKAYRGPRARRDLQVCIKAPAWIIAPHYYQLINGEIYKKEDGEWVLWKEYPVRKPKILGNVSRSADQTP
jgi:hypothetical protein